MSEVYTTKQSSKVIPTKLKGLYRYREINYNPNMKKADAIKLAGSAIKLAKVLGITKGAVSHWGEDIPKGREYELRYLKPEWFLPQKEKETA